MPDSCTSCLLLVCCSVPTFQGTVSRHFPTDDTARLIIRVIVFHFLKRIAREGQLVLLAAEVLDYSFTSAVSDRGHVECTLLLFTAVESQLSERQVSPQLLHGTFRENCLVVMVTADSTV